MSTKPPPQVPSSVTSSLLLIRYQYLPFPCLSPRMHFPRSPLLHLRTLSRFRPQSHSHKPYPSHFLLSNARIFSNPSTYARTMSSAMARRLEGKTILITGASSGIGRSTALEFARTAPKDLRLILTARRIDTLEEVKKDIQKECGDGVKVLCVKLDVSSPDEVRGFVPGLAEEWKEIDVLVNNAGLVKGVAQAPNIAEEDINIMFATNVTGLINMTQAVLPIFKARPDGGKGDVINVGSIAGREPYQGGSIYCATKAAIRSFGDSLRRLLKLGTTVRTARTAMTAAETAALA
ncbi:oxidoreductase protein [Rutstroemia sp. NJR-2017a WRK4]|nr:oxidoreductase protein [Rutstroemia sp. NJR-2017a WRK4]